ncbi:OsmC family protein [Blastococcus sp. MG754426]|uniref:OsmC family protein n=1 Tax=unclassified Blastococcus TaxID=2619396 RepID=UPI001EEF8CF7|nr:MULTISPECIES: OsmC family protein [unclassified Blastococcus]MCF6506634.1 OsmC family protein [Blastococcus sp. MG754426]MCF6510346.1 OsmC family protein [Blastococcus sp. MG754427]
MTTTATANGIDVRALAETIDAIKEDPNLASFTFRARSRWQEGTYNTGEIRAFTHAGSQDESRAAAFTLHGDEPPVLLGANRGPNAVELLLQSLAFCYAVGYVANAAARGIEVTGMEYDIEGDFDVRPFLGLDGPRPGFTAIRARARVSSPNATPEQLQELCRYVQETSPVRDSLVNPVPVETTLEVVPEAT